MELLQGFGLDCGDVEARRQSYETQIEEIGLPEEEVEEGRFEEVPLNNPADLANATRSSGVLNLVLEDASAVSAARVDLSNYISHRGSRMSGTGLCREAVETGGEPNELVFQAYLFEKCGYYGAEMEKSFLKYQIEYILAGEDTDWKNLEAAAKSCCFGGRRQMYFIFSRTAQRWRKRRPWLRRLRRLRSCRH